MRTEWVHVGPGNVKRARKSHGVSPIIGSSFPHQNTDINYTSFWIVWCVNLSFTLTACGYFRARLHFVPELFSISDFITKPKHTAMFACQMFFSWFAFCRLHFLRGLKYRIQYNSKSLRSWRGDTLKMLENQVPMLVQEVRAVAIVNLPPLLSKTSSWTRIKRQETHRKNRTFAPRSTDAGRWLTRFTPSLDNLLKTSSVISLLLLCLALPLRRVRVTQGSSGDMTSIV